MARTPLTLAALATAAVPGLDVIAAQEHSTGDHGDYDSAVLRTRDERTLLIRVPHTQSAEIEQAADLVAVAAISSGVRSRLPFEVPSVRGQAPFESTRAVVYDFLPGRPLELERVHGEIAASAGAAIAAIHSLPTGFVIEAGLPQQTADEAQRAVLSVIDRAQATGSLPAALRLRWYEAASDETLWRFLPTVINGALSADSLLVDGETVRAVLGWSALSIGDPARDLAWAMGAQPDAAESVFSWYEMGRQAAADPRLRQRALLHAELDLARWLLHGHELHDRGIVADAEGMLDTLVDRVHQHGVERLDEATGQVLDAAQVEQLLERTPHEDRGRGADPDGGHSPGFAPVEDANVERQRAASSDDE